MSEKRLPAAPDWFDPKKILAQYVSGQKTEDIAQRLGVDARTLRYHLASHSPEDWKAAVLLTALNRQQEAEDEIDEAKDMLALRKAETKLKSAQWNLERVCRRIYGDVKEAPQQQPVMISINLRRDDDTPGRTIEVPNTFVGAHQVLAEQARLEAEIPAEVQHEPRPKGDAPEKKAQVIRWGEPVKPFQYSTEPGLQYPKNGTV